MVTRLLKIYLDTSVINFLYADDAPEKKQITVEFFDQFILPRIYDAFISSFVVGEIEQTSDPEKRAKLLQVLENYPLEILELSARLSIEDLAKEYLRAGIIPVKKQIDAYHVATSVITQMDFLVSWNYKHLANVNKEKRIRVVNLENNYLHDLRIVTPLELMNYETENF
jgi:predicted nucleic acid-binding protein